MRFFISERIVLSVVIVNSIVLILHEFYDPNPLWFVIDYACVIFFILESGVKIHNYLQTRSWPSIWDPIDLIIVIFSVPILFLPFLDLPNLSGLLILRLGRLFRLFRLMRFIPDSERLFSGVVRALKASVGIFLALCLLNVILSLVAAFAFGDLAPEHFGNPVLAFYSMFKVFTIEGWYEIPEHLLALDPYQTWWWQILIRCFFSGTVLFGGMLGFSLANAVFVDEMVMDNNLELERRLDSLTEEIRSLRDVIADQSGPKD